MCHFILNLCYFFIDFHTLLHYLECSTEQQSKVLCKQICCHWAKRYVVTKQSRRKSRRSRRLGTTSTTRLLHSKDIKAPHLLEKCCRRSLTEASVNDIVTRVWVCCASECESMISCLNNSFDELWPPKIPRLNTNLKTSFDRYVRLYFEVWIGAKQCKIGICHDMWAMWSETFRLVSLRLPYDHHSHPKWGIKLVGGRGEGINWLWNYGQTVVKKSKT